MASDPESLATIARAFIDYYIGEDGCSNCGGQPHSSTCFVGRFIVALRHPHERPDMRPLADLMNAGKWQEATMLLVKQVDRLLRQPLLSVEGLRARVEALRWTCYVDQPDATWACDQVLEILAAPVEATELDRLRNLCAEMYQVAGTLGADARVLDTLSAAANGQPLPHGTLLPCAAPVEARAPQEDTEDVADVAHLAGLTDAQLKAAGCVRAPQPAEPTREALHAATCKGLLYPGLRECTCGGPAYIRSLKAQVATLTTELAEARAQQNQNAAAAVSENERANKAEHQIATLRQELAAALKLADSNLHPGRYPDPASTIEGAAGPSHMHALTAALRELIAASSDYYIHSELTRHSSIAKSERYVIARRAADAALAASEPAAICGAIGHPNAGNCVCELPAGHETKYHKQGGVRWIGYRSPVASEPAAQPEKE